MVDDLAARLRAMNIQESRTHQVATQDDLLTLLAANLGIAIVPVGAVGSQNLVRVPLNDLNLVRKVSAYGVAGRRRSASCTAFLNMLRAADWGFVAPSETQWGMH
jgi:DNA-binding transcriptional LysR family regulator